MANDVNKELRAWREQLNEMYSREERDLRAKGQNVLREQESVRGAGLRSNKGKPDYSLVPLHLMEETAKVLEYGSTKYEAWNWAKGMQWGIPFACMCRHMFAWFRGERNDPESGLSHLAHAMCNLLMLTHYETFYPEGDDRPKEYFSDKETTESSGQQEMDWRQ